MIKKIVGVTLVALLLSTVMVPVLSGITSPSGTSVHGWAYDDYRPIGDATADGALEIVDVGGTAYVHAKAVGPGRIVYGDGTVESVTVSKATLDVVFMYGQSNGAYRYPDPQTADPRPEIGTAYYWGGDTVDKQGNPVQAVYAGLKEHAMLDPESCKIYPVYDETGTLRVGDKMPSFCATYVHATGHKVLWVDGAVGGEPIASFTPGTGTVWVYGKAMLTGALDAVDREKFDVSVTCYLWIQGESNSTTPADVYKLGFMRMHKAMISGEMGPTIPMAFVSTVAYGNTIQALEDLAESDPTIRIATTVSSTFTQANGMMGADNLHYTQKGDNVIGTALGKAAGHYVGGVTDVGHTIGAMIGIIPVLILAGLLMALAVGIVRRRDI